MDLNFIQGLAGNGEQTASSDNIMNYVALKTPEGSITFTYEGDDRLNTAFKDYEKIGLITQVQHSELLNTMNTCEWDLKIDYVDGEFKKVEKYTPDEKALELEKRALAEAEAKYSSEQAIAMRIYNDFALQTEPVTDEEMAEVRTYMKAIKSSASKTMMLNVVTRPAIMERYERGV